MNRRDILKSVVAGASALPAAAQHQGSHVASQTSASARGAGAAWKPLLFDAHQNQTVIAITDLIIPTTDTPGAKAAKVNEYIDLQLNDGPVGQRGRLLKGLGALDGECIRRHGNPFVRCTREEQTTMLLSIQDTPFFRELKALTVQGYYTSKIGIDELNKGGRVPKSFGCAKSDHPIKA